MGRQWMCGFPDKLVVISVDDYLVSVFGNEELVNTFKTNSRRLMKTRKSSVRRDRINVIFKYHVLIYFLPCMVLVYFLAPGRMKIQVLFGSLIFMDGENRNTCR